MTTDWQITVDCTSASRLAAFWSAALGYVPAEVPEGFATWEAWLASHGVPPEERDGVAAIVDPEGRGPRIGFLGVPEPKTVKNRLHLDLRVSGGRTRPYEHRWPLITAEVERLVGLGARVLAEVPGVDGRTDHVVLADPEGNELCVV